MNELVFHAVYIRQSYCCIVVTDCSIKHGHVSQYLSSKSPNCLKLLDNLVACLCVFVWGCLIGCPTIGRRVANSILASALPMLDFSWPADGPVVGDRCTLGSLYVCLSLSCGFRLEGKWVGLYRLGMNCYGIVLDK